MKVTYKENYTDGFPFVVRCSESLVLVTGVISSGTAYKGLMITRNSLYKPFEYSMGEWPVKECEVFHGTITIEC